MPPPPNVSILAANTIAEFSRSSANYARLLFDAISFGYHTRHQRSIVLTKKTNRDSLSTNKTIIDRYQRLRAAYSFIFGRNFHFYRLWILNLKRSSHVLSALPTDNLLVNFISHFWWLRKKYEKTMNSIIFIDCRQIITDVERRDTFEQQQNRSGFLLSPIFFSLFDFDEFWEVLDSQSNNRLKSLFLVSSHYYQNDLFHSTAFNAAHAKCVKWLEKN